MGRGSLNIMNYKPLNFWNYEKRLQETSMKYGHNKE